MHACGGGGFRLPAEEVAGPALGGRVDHHGGALELGAGRSVIGGRRRQAVHLPDPGLGCSPKFGVAVLGQSVLREFEGDRQTAGAGEGHPLANRLDMGSGEGVEALDGPRRQLLQAVGVRDQRPAHLSLGAAAVAEPLQPLVFLPLHLVDQRREGGARPRPQLRIRLERPAVGRVPGVIDDGNGLGHRGAGSIDAAQRQRTRRPTRRRFGVAPGTKQE